jgi:hypothetical protein
MGESDKCDGIPLDPLIAAATCPTALRQDQPGIGRYSLHRIDGESDDDAASIPDPTGAGILAVRLGNGPNKPVAIAAKWSFDARTDNRSGDSHGPSLCPTPGAGTKKPAAGRRWQRA